MIFLKRADIVQQTTICQSVLYERIREGTFPPPIKAGRSSRWIQSEVDAFKLALASGLNTEEMRKFVGHEFLAEFRQTLDKKDNFYNKVVAIQALNPILTDAWTISGHLIKGVRSKSQRNGKILAKSCQCSGNCNPPQTHAVQGLEANPNPIQHTPSKIGT